MSSVNFTREICEFWVQLAANRGLCKQFLKQEHLIRLVPILLKGLQYSESESIVLLNDGLEEEDDSIHLNMENGLNLTSINNSRFKFKTKMNNLFLRGKQQKSSTRSIKDLQRRSVTWSVAYSSRDAPSSKVDDQRCCFRRSGINRRRLRNRDQDMLTDEPRPIIYHQ